MQKHTISYSGLALLLACMLVYVNVITWHWPIRHDNAANYYLGFQLMQGAVPYKDFFALDMPMTILLHALGIALFGPGDNGHRLLYSAWQLFILCSSAAFFGKRARLFGIMAGLFYALYYLSTGIDQMLQREYLMLPFLLLAAYFILRDEKCAGLHPAFIAGMMLGLAFMIKPTAAIYGIFIFVIRTAGIPHRNIVPLIACGIAGGATVVGLILLWLAAIGGAQDFIAMAIHYMPIYQSMGPSPALAADLPWLAPYIAIACVISIPLLAQNDMRCAMLLAGCFYGLLHYFLQSFNFQHRLVPVRFFFTLLCFYTAYHYATFYNRGGRIMVIMLIACACWVVSPFYWNQKSILDRYAERGPRDMVIGEITAAMRPSHESTLQFFDIGEGFFYSSTLLHTVSPSRCNYTPLLYYASENPYVARLQDECLSAIEKNPPAAIAVSSNSYPFFRKPFLVLANPRLANVISAHYTLTAEHPEYRIYSRIN